MGDSKCVMRAQRRKKLRAVQFLGGRCTLCGYDKCLAALEFHHSDPSVKEQKLAYIVIRWAWTRIVPELQKCILVCSNCHREIHYAMYSVEEVQERTRCVLEKVCPACKGVYRTRNIGQVYCSDQCSRIDHRKVPRPTRQELARDMRMLNWTEMGRKYGVTNTAVKKWARQYELLS